MSTKNLLKTSLERPSQGWGGQATVMEGCWRRCTVHAEQCKQARLALLLSELHSAILASIAHAGSARINHPHRTRDD